MLEQSQENYSSIFSAGQSWLKSVNPHYASRLDGDSVRQPALRRVAYARLPMAPVNGSPVPELTSLYHDANPGPYGDRSYPGNCSGNLIHALLRFFQPKSVYDPLTGSGTCHDVCKELGISCWSSDLREGFDACTETEFAERFDFCWLHPPYWRQKRYSDDPRDLSCTPTLKEFLVRYEQLLANSAAALAPGGKMAVLMGDYYDKKVGYVPLVYFTKLLAFRCRLRQHCTDIVRFSHGASSSRKVYRSAFIPGLHDIVAVFEKPA